ncbi:MAG: hypothetical protein ABJP45_08705 [Cyclobacteriaceae bacterium]
MIRSITTISLLTILSCQSKTDLDNEETRVDTLTIKIGDKHLEPTSTSDKVIALKGLNGERITRFYSDSTYELTVEHSFGVRLRLFQRTSNFNIRASDSTYFLTTDKLDSGRTSKLQVGFLTDTTSNILMYHYRFPDDRDSTEVLDFKKQIDTVGYTEFKLYGRKSR